MNATPIRILALLAIPSMALGQSGTLDQVSPLGDASVSSDQPWQQQIRAGLPGRLEGFELVFYGPPGANITVSLRLGDGWNTSPVVWTRPYQKQADLDETVYFDVSAADIVLSPGDTFVVEIQSPDPVLFRGSHRIPPAYPEPMFWNGPGCHLDCNWRIAVRTWVEHVFGTDDCSGDGTGAACPCGNTGSAGTGCANSSDAGALLTLGGSNSAAADDLRFYAFDLLPGQPALLFVGNDATAGGAGLPFGDGLLCVEGSVVRLGVAVPDPAGAAVWGPGLSALGGWTSGDTRRFQVWYRDPGGPCGSSFNLTNALEVGFVP